MRFLSGSLVFLSAIALLPGCSDSNNSSGSTSNVDGWVGAQGLNNAQVVINQVAESGQVSVDSNGIYFGLRESTDTVSRFTANVANDEVLLFIARGQIADVDKDKDNLASQRQCQLAADCSVLDADYKFADFYPATEGFEWRSVVYTVSDGSRNNVNAITTLASAFAYQSDVKYGYDNHQDLTVFENETFTAYDVVLSNSQTSKLLGLQDVIGDLPANLTKLNNFNSNTEAVRNQIRYGALLAGLQQLELTYFASNNAVGDDAFITLVAAQFAEDQGQFYYHAPVVERALTLQAWYQAARDNLVTITASIANVEAKAAANAVVTKLDSDLADIIAKATNTKTTAVADDLSQLLTASEIADFNLGLEKTKLFVNDLLNYQQTFWQADYKTELDEYLLLLKSIGDEHRENLDDLTTEFSRIQSYYVNCAVLVPAAAECTEVYDAVTRKGLLDIDGREKTYDGVNKVLTFTSGITVSQKIADINVLDDIDEPTSSHAMDIFITGQLEKNNLVLTLAHDLDSAEENIDVPSAMRIYYDQEVSQVSPELEIQGYELIWGEFQLYDKTKVGVDFDPAKPELGSETELSGAFRIFYRGIRDPQNTNTPNDSELRFNIDNWVLSSRISDQVDDDAADDREFTSLIITANSSNPDVFYPENILPGFDGFFTVNTDNTLGDEIASLLEYRMGLESVPFGSGSIEVQTIDFINLRNDDIRYRFYPDEKVIDENDSDRDGDIKELVDMHRVEECELDTNGNVTTCGPKSKIFDKVNLQNTINDFWELGLFQRIPVDGEGTYFVDFPTVSDANGCLVLDALVNDVPAMSGSLIEQQVLGLDSVRLFTEVILEDTELRDLPKTLLDVTVVAPTKDRYRITAALSHNYSSTTTDNSGVILGTGGLASSLVVSYDTSADFEDAGNLSVAKGGVTLNLGDGSVVSEDQDMTAFLSQTYDPDSVHYKIIEDAEGFADRCVLSVGSNYEKDPADLEQVFYLNYRDVVYGTVRPEGANNIWTIRYIDGTWMIPSETSSDVATGS
ncbi:MAG: hypothetical protein V7765_09610 [Oleispira sp.]